MILKGDSSQAATGVRGLFRSSASSCLLLTTALGFVAAAGCTTVAGLSNLDASECRGSLTNQLASILVEQGENPQASARLADNTATALATGEFGPRPFWVASPSGADYFFFVQRKSETCLLRLYGRQKGFVSYRNNLTYIATKTLPACQCSEGSAD
jgi:hypothetical protein